MIIDIHAHIWGNRIADCESKLLKAMELYGIDKIYVSGLQSFYSDEAEVEYLTSAVADFVRRYPNQVGGAVYVNPRNENTMYTIRKAIEEQGFEMIKLWVATLADDPAVDPILDYAAITGVPVMLHAIRDSIKQFPTCSTGSHIARIARRHPNVKVLMAHFGGMCHDGIPAVRDVPNVWCDMSGPGFHAEELDYAVQHLGCERVVFGSDMPGPFITNYGQVMGADLTGEQRERILYKNALKLLDRNFRI